jgi:hypothetical protein
MSYGWLTESSLLPGKKKEIEVESKTVINRLFSLLI